LLLSLLASLPAFTSISIFTKAQLASLANLSKWAFLLTFAGVGLKTNIRKQGLRPFIVGAIGELAIAGLTLGLVLGAAALFTL